MSSLIHPTAVISPLARLHESVRVGPYCVIGDHVELGADCVLRSHVVIDGICRIGVGNEFFPFAAIGGKTQDLKYVAEPTSLEIGDHNVFRENTTIHRSTAQDRPTRIGSHNLFLCYSHVAHDCQLGDHIILSNNGTLGGHVMVEDHAIVSGLAAVHQFCRIGEHSIIGGCSKVTQDVPPYMIIDGNPAQTRGINRVGLQRRGTTDETMRALKFAYKMLFLRKEINLSDALTHLSQSEHGAHGYCQHLMQFIQNSERGITR